MQLCRYALDKSQGVLTKSSYGLFVSWKCHGGREIRQFSGDKTTLTRSVQIKVKLMKQRNVSGSKSINMAVFRTKAHQRLL